MRRTEGLPEMVLDPYDARERHHDPGAVVFESVTPASVAGRQTACGDGE